MSKRIVGREEDLRHCRRLHEVKMSWNWHCHPFLSHDVLGLRSSRHDPEDPVADLERTSHVGPECIDLAGVFQPRDIRRHSRRRRVVPARLQQVGPVQSAGMNADAHLVSLRLHSRNLAHFQHLRTANSRDDDCVHGKCEASTGDLVLRPSTTPRSVTLKDHFNEPDRATRATSTRNLQKTWIEYHHWPASYSMIGPRQTSPSS